MLLPRSRPPDFITFSKITLIANLLNKCHLAAMLESEKIPFHSPAGPFTEDPFSNGMLTSGHRSYGYRFLLDLEH